ncbi:preprotein translocase subunit YajC [Aquirhabdus sp.]|uniref:preprotein translocase subunit YajC n=1 Tax=Aquirhabdus sp. TaxID=2824160 RepID=UPI00396CBB61
MSLFIASAYAAPAAAAGPQSALPSILMMVGFVAIFYFLIWRPQSKRTKEHRNMIESVAVGSEVVFAGGLMGRIKKVEGEYAVIVIGTGVDVKVQKSSIVAVLPEGTLAGL